MSDSRRFRRAFWLGLLAGLLVAVGAWSWASLGGSTAVAGEAFLDAASQRQAIIDAQKDTNAKLTELIQLLKSGDVKVQIVQEAKENGAKTDADQKK